MSAGCGALLADRYGTSPRGRPSRRDVADARGRRCAQLGYLHAHVTPRAELAHDPDRATLVFTVEPAAARQSAPSTSSEHRACRCRSCLKDLRVRQRRRLRARCADGADRHVTSRAGARMGFYEAKVTPPSS